MPAQIDHLVLLLPYRDLIRPPAWLSTNFTLSPGGRHSDGRTESRLILFQDGTYLELTAFIEDNPSLRYGHPLGDKPPGFIDIALMAGTPEPAGLRTRLPRRSGRPSVDYSPPAEASRRRPDGKDTKWQITAPAATSGTSTSPPRSRRGEIPFWVHDITPRALRADAANKAHTTHPCGALGLAQLTLLVPRGRGERYVELYACIMDTPPVRVFGTTRLPLDPPAPVTGLPRPWVFVEEAGDEKEARRVKERGAGVVEIAVRVGLGAEQAGVGVARSPVCEYGVWIHFLK
ncbi:glyoxalase-like domain-containing protein [Geopyxis carbonaria]|nr:glyoxalase-like domain-containing protein [Geopyxis carbonaria]